MARGQRPAEPAPRRRRRGAAGKTPADAAEPSPVSTRATESVAETGWPALTVEPGPIVFCAVNAGFHELGLATVLLARRVGARLLCAHFVVDLVANGVLECYGEALGDEDFERYLLDLDDCVPLESCPAELAAALVHEGVRRGEQNGVAQPEPLGFWGRLLPRTGRFLPFQDDDSPVLVAELVAGLRGGDETAWLEEAQVPALPELGESSRDH